MTVFRARAATRVRWRVRSICGRTRTCDLGTSAPHDLEQSLVERPVPRYSGPQTIRDSSELFSAITGHLHPDAALLDVGCGPRDQAAAAEHYGLRYAGVDYSSPAADILVDAHAIPFQAGTFDIVLSYAVLEHLYNPYLAMREMARVLKPDGVLAIAVSQGEPFHESRSSITPRTASWP